MKHLLICLALISGSCLASQPAKISYGQFNPSKFSKTGEVVITGWNTNEGQQRLLESKYKNDYFQLAHNFQPQINPLYCSIATSVIVLNSMRLPESKAPRQKTFEVDVPKSLGGGTLAYPSYSQLTFLNEKTNKIKPKKVIELLNRNESKEKLDPGLQLIQLKAVLETYNANVELFYADNLNGVGKFRERIKKALQEDKQFVIVNFFGKEIGAPTAGHVSPLSAYHEKSDSVLIMDVAGFKNPWYWVPVEHLYRAMHTKDGNTYRGYLLVKERN